MVGSLDSLDFSPELTIPAEENVIRIKCWQDVSLPNIWIPSHLLPSREKPSNSRIIKGIFHTLQEKDYIKYDKSFSVYTEEEEIFLSDSEEDILGCTDDVKCEKRLPENTLTVNTGFALGDTSTSESNKMGILIDHQYKNKQYENLELKNRTSNLKAMPSVDNLCNIGIRTTSGINSPQTVNTISEQHKESAPNQQKTKDSHISLSDILDNTPEFNINDFRTKDKECLGIQENKLESNQKKNKKKKKPAKHIPLDEFLEDYQEEDLQNDCCNDYFKKLLREKNMADGMQIRSTAEFPNLVPNDPKFIHLEKVETKDSGPSLKTLTEILSQSNENSESTNIACKEEAVPEGSESEKICGKLIIENIPNEVSEDDIYSFLSEYGEIKDFSLQPVGEFFKAYLEIDLICDIDWIIECLNGTDPFGASTRMLKCYKQE